MMVMNVGGCARAGTHFIAIMGMCMDIDDKFPAKSLCASHGDMKLSAGEVGEWVGPTLASLVFSLNAALSVDVHHTVLQ